MLKATDMCATEPEKAAQRLVEGGFARNYDYALDMITGLRYDAWREIDSEHSLRFYAEQLHEARTAQVRPRQRSSRTAPTGGSSTSSSAN